MYTSMRAKALSTELVRSTPLSPMAGYDSRTLDTKNSSIGRDYGDQFRKKNQIDFMLSPFSHPARKLIVAEHLATKYKFNTSDIF